MLLYLKYDLIYPTNTQTRDNISQDPNTFVGYLLNFVWRISDVMKLAPAFSHCKVDCCSEAMLFWGAVDLPCYI